VNGRLPARIPGAPRVVHMTSVHPPDDARIFAKECRTLATLGYDVNLIAPGAGAELRQGVRLWAVPIPTSSSRVLRMTRTVTQVYRLARKLDADIYHLHDPELILAGLLLDQRGKRVIYDAHEDVPEDILVKAWIRPGLRMPISRLAAAVEQAAARRFSAVVAATPTIEERFAGHGCRAVTVSNFPQLTEFDGLPAADQGNERAVCYVGSISELRGARCMVEAMADLDATLLLAGRFSPPDLRDKLVTSPGWPRVVELGYADRAEVARTLYRSRAGLAVLARLPTYMAAQPTKVYEYMAAGIPVIASNFPRWRAIVEGSGCGICVDPGDPGALARAIAWILDHPREAKAMGANGRRAVETRYSWQPEARRLAALYETVLA
jgi:glycosyltransferase involved in cell wall biosynthesis